MSDILEQTTAVAVPIEQMTAVQVFRPGGVDDVLDRIRREIAAVDPATIDPSTEKGRRARASLAFKVARSKTALDAMGKSLNDGKRAEIDAVDAERRRIRTECDAMAEELRRPNVEHEQRQAARIANHEAALASIVEAPECGQTESAETLRIRLHHLRNYPARDWEEFALRAEHALAAEIRRTEGLVAIAEQREAREAEAARLAAEQAERNRLEAIRQREEREAHIAAQAAQRAREEAEARAAQEAERERLAVEKREREAREAADRERRAAEAREQAARDAAEAATRAAERAEAERVAAEERAAKRAQEAAAQAERDREAAVAAERQRVAREAEVQRQADERRAADRAHRAAINNKIVEALIDLSLSGDQARAVVEAMARGKVPHVTIGY